MNKDTRSKKSESDAKQSVLQELFDDLYNNRVRVYKFNFVRGLFFGAGSAIGGTFIIAFLIWVLTLFVDVPVIGDAFNDTLDSIQNTSPSTPTQRN